MTYRIELLPGEPIVVVYISPEYSISRDMMQSDADGEALLDTLDKPVFWITDLTNLKVSIDDVVLGANQGAEVRIHCGTIPASGNF